MFVTFVTLKDSLKATSLGNLKRLAKQINIENWKEVDPKRALVWERLIRKEIKSKNDAKAQRKRAKGIILIKRRKS